MSNQFENNMDNTTATVEQTKELDEFETLLSGLSEADQIGISKKLGDIVMTRIFKLPELEELEENKLESLNQITSSTTESPEEIQRKFVSFLVDFIPDFETKSNKIIAETKNDIIKFLVHRQEKTTVEARNDLLNMEHRQN